MSNQERRSIRRLLYEPLWSIGRRGGKPPSSSSETDLRVSRAGVATPHSRVTGSLLQAEAGLVSLGHLAPRGDVQQVVMTEGVHAVEVPDGTDGTGSSITY